MLHSWEFLILSDWNIIIIIIINIYMCVCILLGLTV